MPKDFHKKVCYEIGGFGPKVRVVRNVLKSSYLFKTRMFSNKISKIDNISFGKRCCQNTLIFIKDFQIPIYYKNPRK